MKKVAIVGLGWLGMPLALSLQGAGYQVIGSKTNLDGVNAAQMCGIETYLLRLNPQLECDSEDLSRLLDVDVLIITLPAICYPDEGYNYFYSVQQLVDSALAYKVPRVIFLSSTSVYGEVEGWVDEQSILNPSTATGLTLVALERWLHSLPHISVDILRLAGLVGNGRHPGRFLAGKRQVRGGCHGVNLVHQEDAIAALLLLLQQPQGGHLYNLCAPKHPCKQEFYPPLARSIGLEVPQFSPENGSGGKLVSGELITQQLGFIYRYPDPFEMTWS